MRSGPEEGWVLPSELIHLHSVGEEVPPGCEGCCPRGRAAEGAGLPVSFVGPRPSGREGFEDPRAEGRTLEGRKARRVTAVSAGERVVT